MKRIIFSLFLYLPSLGVSGCALNNSIDSYDRKECEEIRKLAQEQFLLRDPLKPKLSSDDSNANEILGVLFQDDRNIDEQARKISYQTRCRS